MSNIEEAFDAIQKYCIKRGYIFYADASRREFIELNKNEEYELPGWMVPISMERHFTRERKNDKLSEYWNDYRSILKVFRGEEWKIRIIKQEGLQDLSYCSPVYDDAYQRNIEHLISLNDEKKLFSYIETNYMDRMEKLRREIYYCDGDPKNPESHKGFVGEAYCRAAKFYEKNVDMFEEIANKELPRLNNEQDYDYEIDIYDDIYAVKFSYFYASECSYIYKRAFEKFFEEKGGPEKAEEYISKNGLKIISVGAGNFVDYWGLEAAQFLLNFSDDVISNIQYEAYEYKEWGSKGVNKTSSDGISRMMNCEKHIYKIKNKKFHIGPEDGNIFNAKNGNADIIFFSNSFNELQKQRPDEFSKLLKNLKSNNNDTIVAITYHTGEKDGSVSIESVFKGMDFVNAEKIDDKNTKSIIIDDQGMEKSCKNYFLENDEGRSVFYNKQQDERNKKANYSILEDEKVENSYLSNCANKDNGGSPTFYGGNNAGRYNIMKENDNLNYVIYKMSAK